ncbi:MAG: PKD domain-containing protein [Bacteroidetes bacterium]|nr:PKD domain-containing protein [Bacteroidota bacterium]
MKKLMLCMLILVSLAGTSLGRNMVLRSQEPLRDDSINCMNYFTYITNDNLTFSFTGHVYTTDPASYHWNFGDGTTADGQYVTHTFEQTGMTFYLVCLQTFIFTPAGDTCEFTSCQEVWVGNQTGCEAMFYYYPADSSLNDLTYQFVDQSWGNPATWNWDFGDGTFSSLQNPQHTYAISGIYQVCLTISDGTRMCQDTWCEEVYIGTPPPPSGCTSYFTYIVENEYSVTFTGVAYYNGNVVNANSYIWDFGDGTTGEGETVTHTFGPDPAGNEAYYVCLQTEIIDSLTGIACTAYYCEMIFLNNMLPCMAGFYYYPFDSVYSDFTYQFIDISSGDPESWLWDFGDGTTSDIQNPVHTFSSVGAYDVCLTINNPVDSCQDTYCQSVFIDTIISNCESYFLYYVDNLDVSFEGYPYTMFSLTWEWQFGDGTTGSCPFITHTYASEGTYTVVLITTDEAGCMYSSTQEIYVGTPVAYLLYGSVIVDNAYADQAMATLFRMDDPAGGLYIVDEQPVDSAGMYHFENVITGNYYILTELLPGSINYGSYLPTYYGDVIFWGDATMISLGEPQNPYNINMIPVTNFSPGPGSINGIISQELDFAALGSPASDIEIILISETGTAISYYYSEVDGTFDFSGLGFGVYQIYAEVPGKITIPLLVTLTENTPSVFVEIVISGQYVNVINGVNDPVSPVSSVGEIYPNPVTNESYLEMTFSKPATIEVIIVNQMGQTIDKYSMTSNKGIQRIPVNPAKLLKGIYLLKIADDAGNIWIRKFLK